MFISVIVVTMLAPVSETFFNSNDGYRYEEYISVYPFMVEGGTSYSDKEYDKYSDIIKEFIEKISLMDGNISMDLSLNQIISKLGAPSIFQPGTADFSRFANGKPGDTYRIVSSAGETSEAIAWNNMFTTFDVKHMILSNLLESSDIC